MLGFGAVADDPTKTINSRVPAEVYRAIEAMTGGPLGITQAQVVRMLITEALEKRGLIGAVKRQETEAHQLPTEAPAEPHRPGRKVSGGREDLRPTRA